MKTKSSDKFKEVLKKTIDPDATGVIDMGKEISKPMSDTMSGEDYVKIREQLDNVMANINANKMMGEGSAAYKKQIPAMVKKAKELVAKLAESGAEKLGRRGLKAIPILGTGLGIVDAAKAASEGNYKKAGLEALSAIDPTPITDIYMAGQEVLDAMEDQKEPPRPNNLKALQAAGLMADQPTSSSNRKMIKADPSLIKAGLAQEMPINKKPQTDSLRNLVGEVESPDLEEMDGALNYEDYLKKKKRQLGYE